MNIILEDILPKNYPIDLINLITSYVCDCHLTKCNYCKVSFSDCCLQVCALCKNRSCGLNKCLKFNVDFIMTYASTHKELKCCHKCPECLGIEFSRTD